MPMYGQAAKFGPDQFQRQVEYFHLSATQNGKPAARPQGTSATGRDPVEQLAKRFDPCIKDSNFDRTDRDQHHFDGLYWTAIQR